MSIWLIRAGSHGEYEQKFIQENRVYVCWEDLDVDLTKLRQRDELKAAITEHYPDTKPKAIQNWVSQIWPFAHEMKKRRFGRVAAQVAARYPDCRDDW